jgi:hypothetical protein
MLAATLLALLQAPVKVAVEGRRHSSPLLVPWTLL